MKITIKQMALVSLFAALTAISAFISIPAAPVMITLQTFTVLLSGIILGPRVGAISQIIYILLGLIGLPIFSGFTGGLQSVLKPSFGFLIGFVFASYTAGKILYTKNANGKKISFKSIFIASACGSVVIYLFGLPYMYFILNSLMNMNFTAGYILKIGCLIFLPGDLLKIILASFLSVKLLPVFKKRNIITEV